MFETYKPYIQKLQVKSKLKTCFRRAGLCFDSMLGTRKVYAYPKVHSIKLERDFVEIVFTLLVGMDPAEMKKKAYIFGQMFGKGIEIEGDLKRFTLVAYKKEFKETYDYNFDEIYPHVKNLKLGVIAGKNRQGEYVSFDLTKRPHILIAGETGSGKSTQLRSVLSTMILCKKPHELELYLADLKKSEFHIYRNVSHVKSVHSSTKDVVKMLRHIKRELDERSNLTEMYEVAHIDDLPFEVQKPYIVVCIDEFVMLRKNDEVMEILTEIVAIGRSLGVLAILSMQRPSSKILDTTIRANLTVSMGFKLRDRIEANIVNTPNAEKIDLEGRFIMNSDQMYELQSPYLDIKEAKKLLDPFCIPKGPVKKVNESEVIEEKEPENDLDILFK